jgi:hypothetical protein
MTGGSVYQGQGNPAPSGGGLNNFIPFGGARPSGGIRGSTPSSAGSLTIDLTLSPDLEARVVTNAMNGVAEVITNVARV